MVQDVAAYAPAVSERIHVCAWSWQTHCLWLHDLKKKKILFINLILAVLGLHCHTGLSLVTASWDYSLVALPKLLIEVTSLVAEFGL